MILMWPLESQEIQLERHAEVKSEVDLQSSYKAGGWVDFACHDTYRISVTACSDCVLLLTGFKPLLVTNGVRYQSLLLLC